MNCTKIRYGSMRFFLGSAAALVIAFAFSVCSGWMSIASAGEDAGAEKPPAKGNAGAPVPASEAEPKTQPRTKPKPKSIHKAASLGAIERVQVIMNDIMREHRGDPADFAGLELELVKLGPSVVDVLVKRLSLAETPHMKSVLAGAIARITGCYMPHVTHRDIQHIQMEWWEKAKTRKFDELRAERLKELTERMKKEGKFIELYGIADALAYIRDPKTVAALRELLGHDDSPLKQKALIALGRQESAAAVKIIVPYLKSKDERAAVSAITALGISGAAAAKSERHLAPLLESVSVPRRLAAVLALGRLGDRGHAAILKEIIEDKDASSRHRIWALNILAEAGSYSDYQWISELLSTRDAFCFYHVGKTLERLVWKTFGFADAENVSLEKRRKLVEKFKSWKVNSRRESRERHLVSCLTDPNWLFRKRAFEELKSMVRPGEVESDYDPISKVTDREMKADPWGYWLEDRERGR